MKEYGTTVHSRGALASVLRQESNVFGESMFNPYRGRGIARGPRTLRHWRDWSLTAQSPSGVVTYGRRRQRTNRPVCQVTLWGLCGDVRGRSAAAVNFDTDLPIQRGRNPYGVLVCSWTLARLVGVLCISSLVRSSLAASGPSSKVRRLRGPLDPGPIGKMGPPQRNEPPPCRTIPAPTHHPPPGRTSIRR